MKSRFMSLIWGSVIPFYFLYCCNILCNGEVLYSKERKWNMSAKVGCTEQGKQGTVRVFVGLIVTWHCQASLKCLP